MPNNFTIGVNRVKTKTLILGIAALAFTAALAAVLALTGGSTRAAVGGPTCNVPADYATIQLAVNDPGCTTIKVASGTYTENVTIGRTLTLKGAEAGNNFNSRTFGDASESTVTGAIPASAVFTVNAPNVTIDGFSVTHPTGHLGILVQTAANGAVIKNNILDTIGSAALAINPAAIYLEYGPDSVKVLRNKINNVQSIPTAQGVLVGDSTSANPSLDIRIDGNSISNVTSTTRGAYGIQINNGANSAPTSTGYTEVEIRGNTIKNLTGGGWAHGIGLEGETPNVVVKYNTISGLIDQTPTPFNNAIAVFFENNQFFFTGQVNRNSLAVGPSAYGIAVSPGAYTSLSVNGECNWWGASNGPGPVGPGSGSLVTNNVDYKPWLKSANLNKDCGDKNNHDNDDHRGDWDSDKHKDDDRRGRDD